MHFYHILSSFSYYPPILLFSLTLFPLFLSLRHLLHFSFHLMLRNTMTNIGLHVFCLENGEAVLFSVKVDQTKTVDDLKKLIKSEKTPWVDDVVADELTLWRASVPVAALEKH